MAGTTTGCMRLAVVLLEEASEQRYLSSAVGSMVLSVATGSVAVDLKVPIDYISTLSRMAIAFG